MLPKLVFQATAFMYYITCPPHLPLYYACMRWMDWTLTKIAKTWENYISGWVAPWWHRLYLVHTFIIHYTFYTVHISYKGYITFLYFVWCRSCGTPHANLNSMKTFHFNVSQLHLLGELSLYHCPLPHKKACNQMRFWVISILPHLWRHQAVDVSAFVGHTNGGYGWVRPGAVLWGCGKV